MFNHRKSIFKADGNPIRNRVWRGLGKVFKWGFRFVITAFWFTSNKKQSRLFTADHTALFPILIQTQHNLNRTLSHERTKH